MNKRYVSWQEVEDFVDKLVKEVNKWSFTGVYGLPRGGLPIAVMLSHRLHIPLLMNACDGCLIVDDICDSGESLLHYRDNASGSQHTAYYVATMFYRANQFVLPDFWLYRKEEDWIVFPWENKED